MLRILLATSTTFFSLVLGAVVMGVVWYFAPETMQSIFKGASAVKNAIVNMGVPATYNNFLALLVQESQLVFMAFVLGTRVVLETLVALVQWVFAKV